jgi:hypothetical protein
LDHYHKAYNQEVCFYKMLRVLTPSEMVRSSGNSYVMGKAQCIHRKRKEKLDSKTSVL